MKGAAFMAGLALLKILAVQAAVPRCGDVCFAIDESGSIANDANFQMETDQVIRITESLMDISSDVQLSALTFASSVSVVSTLTSDANQFIADVDAETFTPGGLTFMDRALLRCRRILRAGDPSRPKTLVLLTDGRPTRFSAAVQAANLVKNSNIRLITIGFVDADLTFLSNIASPDDMGNPLSFDSETLTLDTEIVDQIALDICGGACQIACEECDLKFQGEECVPVYEVPTTPDESFTPKIVMKSGDPVIGIVNSNNLPPEFIEEDAGVTEVQQFELPGQKYSRSQFKPYSIRPNSQMSGIGHENFQGAAQRQNAKDKCVRVFFSAYQILNPTTRQVVENVNNRNNKGTNCAVFRTAA